MQTILFPEFANLETWKCWNVRNGGTVFGKISNHHICSSECFTFVEVRCAKLFGSWKMRREFVYFEKFQAILLITCTTHLNKLTNNILEHFSKNPLWFSDDFPMILQNEVFWFRSTRDPQTAVTLDKQYCQTINNHPTSSEPWKLMTLFFCSFTTLNYKHKYIRNVRLTPNMQVISAAADSSPRFCDDDSIGPCVLHLHLLCKSST